MLGICLTNTKPLFDLGQVVMTHGAIDALTESGQTPETFLRRHVIGDWGNVCSDDAKANEDAIAEGLRILSAYKTDTGQKLWIITEYDRSLTTILLPAEY